MVRWIGLALMIQKTYDIHRQTDKQTNRTYNMYKLENKIGYIF